MENGKSVYAGPAPVIEDLDVLPVPDYDDYFDRLRVSPRRNGIGPSILVESARGCWWGEKSHCTFEVPEDYEKNLDLVKMISHLDPPAGCGPIRLDRFSPNYNRAGEKGLTNVRPFKFYKYCYAFDDRTLSDLIYYFDFDYKEEIDDGGYIPALEETVIRWKNIRDSLYVERRNNGLVIRDSRPVATYPELSVTGIAARIYEYCDRAQTLARIVEVTKESVEENVTEEQVSSILEEFINRKLMVQEGNRYLSLAVMTYTTEFERQESERVEAMANRTIEALPQLVQLQPMMAR